MILSLDPSSTLTGYAVMARDATLIECGLLRPRPAKGPWWARCESVAGDIRELVQQHGVTQVIIETPSAHVGARHKGSGAGLAVYGAAVGWLAAYCRFALRVEVEPVSVDEWKSGARGKPHALAAAMYPRGYDAKADKGGDAADAILLARYWLSRCGSRPSPPRAAVRRAV